MEARGWLELFFKLKNFCFEEKRKCKEKGYFV